MADSSPTFDSEHHQARLVSHSKAIWADRADHNLIIDLTRFKMPGTFESLPVAKAPDDLWMICCLPFFCYGFALFDLVRNDSRQGAVVVHKSGRQLIRLIIEPSANVEPIHIALHRWVVNSSLQHEWHADGYLAVDVADAQNVPNWDAVQGWIDNGTLFAEVAG